MHYINDLSPDMDGQKVTLNGWIANVRSSKTNLFFVMRDGSGYADAIVSLDNVGEAAFEEAKRLRLESAVRFEGTLAKNERQEAGFEIQVDSLHIYHVSQDYPLAKREKEYGVRFLADHRHLWLRKRRQWAIMRVRNQIIMGIHHFFQKEGFVQMDAPIFTGNACEGTTELFETDFFGSPAYFSQSGQLYGEAMAMAMGKIYTFGPTFRAEKSDTPRHLAEFWMIEPEMAFYTNEMNMDLIEQFIKYVIQGVLDNCAKELQVLERDTTVLENAVQQTFPRVPYTDAVKILRGEMEVNGKNALEVQKADLEAAQSAIAEKETEIEERQTAIKAGMKKGARKFNEAKIIALRGEIEVLQQKVENIPNWIKSAENFQDGEDFGGSDETVLTRVFDAPVMVYNWPTKIKAFYMKEVDGDPEHVKGVDLLAPEGFGEIIGGSERETDIEILQRKIKEHELPEEEFEWYLDLRRFGSVPHSGFGLGLERMVRWMCHLSHMRETIPFPRRYGQLMP